jgi:hypothetical protein
MAELGALRAENERLGTHVATQSCSTRRWHHPLAISSMRVHARHQSVAELSLSLSPCGSIAGALPRENVRLERLLEQETRRADEADGRLRVASEQLNWAIPQVRLPACPPARPPARHCLECAHSLLPVPTCLMHTHCTQAERRLRASIDSESGVSLASVGGGGSSSSAGTGGGGGGGSTRSSVSLGTPPISPRRPIGGGAGGAITARDVPTTSSSGALAPDQATATEGAAEASSRRAGGTVGGGLAGARLVPRSPPDP